MLLRLLLAWAAAVPTLGQAPWATGPRAACFPGSCASSAAPHHLLGGLAGLPRAGGRPGHPRTLEEARRVDSLVGSGPASRLLWIGLQQQARQCQPQRPLRGFTWTTGDQDTAFTNWAQPATSGPCPAQRCARLENWRRASLAEGSCTLAVVATCARFGFEAPAPHCLRRWARLAQPSTPPFHLVSAEFVGCPLAPVAAVPCQAGRKALSA